MSKIVITTAITAVLVVTIHASDNGLARTPQMGWVSCLAVRCLTCLLRLLSFTGQLERLRLLSLFNTPSRHRGAYRPSWSQGLGISLCSPG